jgi:hypothetical protein
MMESENNNNNQSGIQTIILVLVLVLLVVFIGGFSYLLIKVNSIASDENSLEQLYSKIDALETKIISDKSSDNEQIADNSNQQVADKQAGSAVETKTGSEYIDLGNGLSKYVNYDLGVAFQVDYSKQRVYQTDRALRIEMKDSPAIYQTVVVFEKDSQASLKKAVEDAMLKAYKSEDCYVAVSKGMNDWDKAQIEVPVSDDDTMEQITAKWGKCPQQYTTTNGISYFLSDPSVKSKMAYFLIGQFSMDIDEAGTGWQTTFEFLND